MGKTHDVRNPDLRREHGIATRLYDREQADEDK